MFTPVIRLIPYAGEAAFFPQTPLGWVMHAQAGNGDPFNYWASLKKPHRKFAHYWISKRGVCKQYQVLPRESWAQTAGNPSYYAVEFEGYRSEMLTPLQITTGARLHNALRSPDLIANKPGQRGIGLHSMGGAPWGDGICPGPVRAGQRLSIIAAAQMLRHPYNPHPYPGPYQIGSVGIVVKQIQCRLNKYGYRLKIDGIFGERTEVAVIGFQKYHGLVGDGIVGPLTWKRLWV